MNRDTLYNILYKDGKCNHDSDILDILKDIIRSETSYSININDIDRWNIYGSDTLHIVYNVLIMRSPTRRPYLESYEVKVPVEEFTNRYREYQLNKLVC